MISFIHFLYPLIPIKGRGEAGAYPSCHWVRGRVHPGQVASPSQGHTETNESHNHSSINGANHHTTVQPQSDINSCETKCTDWYHPSAYNSDMNTGQEQRHKQLSWTVTYWMFMQTCGTAPFLHIMHTSLTTNSRNCLLYMHRSVLCFQISAVLLKVNRFLEQTQLACK